MTHTPGPWSLFVPDDDEVFSEYNDDDASDDAVRRFDLGMASISAPGWDRFAFAVTHVSGDRDDAGMANARLIAAAPDLLAAIRDVLWMITADQDDEEERYSLKEYEETIGTAMAAIGKAEGK